MWRLVLLAEKYSWRLYVDLYKYMYEDKWTVKTRKLYNLTIRCGWGRGMNEKTKKQDFKRSNSRHGSKAESFTDTFWLAARNRR